MFIKSKFSFDVIDFLTMQDLTAKSTPGKRFTFTILVETNNTVPRKDCLFVMQESFFPPFSLKFTIESC